MTNGSIDHIVQDTNVSVVSGITSAESTNTDNGLSIEEKKRKIEVIEELPLHSTALRLLVSWCLVIGFTPSHQNIQTPFSFINSQL